jgi:hypothetical protein
MRKLDGQPGYREGTLAGMSKKPGDREAVEHIIGRPLPQDWPEDALPAGTRVTVIQAEDWAGPWRQVFTGTIDDMAAPEPVGHPDARDGELAYWVDFDEPQHDTSDDGPYRMACIWGRYLRAE